MTMQSNFRRIAVVAAAALAMALGAGAAIAQPATGPMGPGAGGPHGLGAGGPHGPGGAEAMIGGIIQKAKAQLNLNTGQQEAFDRIVASAKTERDAARVRHQNLRETTKTQLTTTATEPNLRAIAALADDVAQQDRSARIKIRDQWLTFYETSLTSEQKLVVRDMLQKRIAHMESFRQKMQEWMQQHHGATSG